MLLYSLQCFTNRVYVSGFDKRINVSCFGIDALWHCETEMAKALYDAAMMPPCLFEAEVGETDEAEDVRAV